MTDEMDAAIDRLRDTLRAEKVGQGDVVSAAMQAKDARIAELEAELATERENADRLAGAIQSFGADDESMECMIAIAAHMKMRGL